LSDTVQFLCKNITNPTKTLADKIMVAVSHVSDLIGGIGDGDKADEAMEELERLAEATRAADQNGTLNSDCNENENSAVPRVQTAPDIPTEPLEYRDPDANVTRSITQRMEKNPIQKVDEMQPPRKQVPRVDKSMDAATKTTIAKRKQSVPRVTAQKRQSVPRVEKNKKSTPSPIATRTRAKKKTGGPIANRTRGQRAAQRVASAVGTAPPNRSTKQRALMRNMQQKNGYGCKRS